MPEHAPPPPLLLTCEHGGNAVPREYRRLFARAAFDLRSHRGWDPGAFALAKALARSTRAPLFASTVTRLLIDLNRSLINPAAFSRFTAALPADEREAIVRSHYTPHRSRVTGLVERQIGAGAAPVVHVGVHSFTPVLRGKRRDVHVGLLFDPARPLEVAFCRAWRDELARLRPRWTVALNRPYRGTDDGLTTTLRARFAPADYLGIELEVVHTILTRTGPALRRVHEDLGRSLAFALAKIPTCGR